MVKFGLFLGHYSFFDSIEYAGFKAVQVHNFDDARSTVEAAKKHGLDLYVDAGVLHSGNYWKMEQFLAVAEDVDWPITAFVLDEPSNHREFYGCAEIQKWIRWCGFVGIAPMIIEPRLNRYREFLDCLEWPSSVLWGIDDYPQWGCIKRYERQRKALSVVLKEQGKVIPFVQTHRLADYETNKFFRFLYKLYGFFCPQGITQRPSISRVQEEIENVLKFSDTIFVYAGQDTYLKWDSMYMKQILKPFV